MKRYFVLGTDTDCGKTYVTGQLVHFLQSNGYQARAIKPLASGCSEHQGIMISEDALYLTQYNGVFLDERKFYRFARPISPHIAAAESGVELSIESIATICDSMPADSLDFHLVEGAGGLMVPLNAKETWIEFLKYTKMPVILVVGMKLGCLNHALLTEAVLKKNAIHCVGWIANCLNLEMLALQENIQTLIQRLDMPLLSTVRFSGQIESLAAFFY
jgi:dethiobiotin synthetase